MPEAGSCRCLPLPGFPWNLVCSQGAAQPSWAAELWEGAGSGSPTRGVLVHIPASGLQPFLVGLRSSPPGWVARWDVLGSSKAREPTELPGAGGLGYPLHLRGPVILGSRPRSFPAKHSRGRGEECGLRSGGPPGAVAATVPPGFPPPGSARRAGGPAARACRGGQATLAAGSSSVPPCPLQVPPRVGDSGSRGCAGGTASTWGAEGCGGAGNHSSHSCFARLCLRHASSGSAGRAAQTSSGGGEGGAGVLPPPTRPGAFGEVAARQEVTLFAPANRHGVFLEGLSALPSAGHARRLPPLSREPCPRPRHGSTRAGSWRSILQPQLFLPPVPLPDSRALGGMTKDTGTRSARPAPALPGPRGQWPEECGRGALALCPPWHGKTRRQRRERLGGGTQLSAAAAPGWRVC